MKSNKRNYVWHIFGLGMLVLSLVVTGCGQNAGPGGEGQINNGPSSPDDGGLTSEPDDGAGEVVQEPPTYGWPVSSSPDEPRLVYTSEYGFQITLPPLWAGYRVTELEADGRTSLCFTFPESGPMCVLQIDVLTHEAWQNLEKVHPDYYLDESDEYVFAAGPFTDDCVQLDEFQCERYHEIPEILEGFTLSSEIADCEAQGGRWMVVGMIGYGCNLPTADGGAECLDSADCESLCLADDDTIYVEADGGFLLPDGSRIEELNSGDDELTGVCSAWQSTPGCKVVLESGEYVVMCTD